MDGKALVDRPAIVLSLADDDIGEGIFYAFLCYEVNPFLLVPQESEGFLITRADTDDVLGQLLSIVLVKECFQRAAIAGDAIAQEFQSRKGFNDAVNFC